MGFKNILSYRQKYKILLFLQKFKRLYFFKNLFIDPNKKHAYVFLAADYGNLGDVAITYAQTQFIKSNSDFEAIEIPISKSLEGFWFVKKNIKKGDVITIVGGGNLGDRYDQIEYKRQLVVKYFPKNRIISFPQTFDFSNSEKGKKALRIARKTYNSHADFHFIAREKISYELMKKYFPKANVSLTPDIVISLDKQKTNQVRNGVVICMRQDKEKNLSEKQSLFIEGNLKKRFAKITYYDTHIDRDNLSVQERENELNKIWSAFRSAELVVTDRLHGMIFCYITNTPCLVFQNNNHKIHGSYEWIKENSNINLVSEYSEKNIKNFLEQQNFNIGSLVNMSKNYQSLANLIK